MKPRKKLPAGYSFEQLKNHYEVEKKLSNKLRSSTRNQRKELYRCIYRELFDAVENHPRLMGRALDTVVNHPANIRKYKLIDRYLNSNSVVVEFGPGDCSFAYYIAGFVSHVYAIDISDQSVLKQKPKNFELIIYDGYTLPKTDISAHIIFSDDFVEHLHPDDVLLHFELAASLLKPKGVYVLRTPHAFFGPHDISQYFSDTPEGFHLKEWTFSELKNILNSSGFTSLLAFHKIAGHYFVFPFSYFLIIEKFISHLRPDNKRKISRFFLPHKIVIHAFNFQPDARYTWRANSFFL